MRPPFPRIAPVALTTLALLGAPLVFAQKEQAETRAATRSTGRPLDPEVFAVRLLLGLNDPAPRVWNGRVTVDRGEVVAVEGGRFHKGDRVNGREAWEARSVLVRKAAAKKAAAKKASAANKATGGPSTEGAAVMPNIVTISLKAPADATLKVTTDQGEFSVPLADLAAGAARRELDGRAVVQRVPTSVGLIEGPEEEDFPAAAPDGSNGAWVVYVAHAPRGPDVLAAYTARPKSFADLAPKGGGDQVKLVHFSGGKAEGPIDVTTPGLDVWRPAVALDTQGQIHVVWSENREGNFELYRRRYDPKARVWSEQKRLTDNAGTDADPVLASGPDGAVWLAWQQWAEGRARVRLKRVDGDEPGTGNGSPATGEGRGNEWSPALAVDSKGNPWVAFDSYAAGNYDVLLTRFRPDGSAAGPPIAVANSPRFEARPSLAIDSKNRAWVAYEERTKDWGKDAENLISGQGSTLYRSSAVRARVVDGDRVLDAPDPLVSTAPTAPIRAMNGFPRLATDTAGRVWLAFRHRQEAIWGNNAVMVVGGVWVEYVTALAGPAWTTPQPVPNSDGLLDNRPAFVPRGSDSPLLIYSSDGRLRREVEHSPELTLRYYSHSGTPPGVVNNDLFAAAPSAPKGSGEPTLSPIVTTAHDERSAVVHGDEPGDVARMRTHRVEAGGKTYRLLRGDFHRHTEVSQDGGADGALEDMWRYAIDAAGFDWMGNADHDNGGSKEYTWWLVQKTTDLYNSPSLTTLFTYERSVSYPHGHRNVMFAKRGVRTLPRLVEQGKGVVDDDTKMLYDYLSEHQGICASHTSATGMGTDWRDVNSVFEPIVEIFQGHRNSYEHFGAPRVARRAGESIGGWQPLGMVWNALAMQYRVGFQASSDHISTHISYAIAVAEDTSREAVIEAFRRRHCYGATDNIVMDVRTADGAHMMGDEFDAPTAGPVKLKVFVHGTRPIARVDVIKDFVYAYSTEPKTAKVSFEWTDSEARGPGLSWYYVRAIQDDGQLAWASPMWVRSPAR